MAQPIVRIALEGFREPDLAKDDRDSFADEAEIDAIETALRPLLARLEVLFAKSRPGFDPPDVHSND